MEITLGGKGGSAGAFRNSDAPIPATPGFNPGSSPVYMPREFGNVKYVSRPAKYAVHVKLIYLLVASRKYFVFLPTWKKVCSKIRETQRETERETRKERGRERYRERERRERGKERENRERGKERENRERQKLTFKEKNRQTDTDQNHT